MDEKHERRSDKIIEQIQDDVKEIKDSLIGTLTNDGYMKKTSDRINELETKTSEKISKLEDKVAVQWWLIAMIIITIMSGAFKIFFS